MTTPPEGYFEYQEHGLNIAAIAAGIAAVQTTDGDIPWWTGHKTDPWDMVEAAMGLSIGGYPHAAERAYRWLIRCQNPDGSWYASYRNGIPEDTTRDANLSAYIAVGIYQHYLVTGNRSLLEEAWPAIVLAIDFALGLQSPQGEIYWAISPENRIDRMALLTGSSSICMSIRCALAIARLLGHRPAAWESGLARLVHAICEKPQRFNMTKSRYAMDWYYPVLCGVFVGQRARHRIDHLWKKFVIEGQGVRCVSDRPWVTIAETAELCLALAAAGLRPMAQIVFGWIADKHYEDGMYWAGFTYPEMTIWPQDRLTWTGAAVLLAADALYDLTPAARLFSHEIWRRQARAPAGTTGGRPT
ncbi:MAG: phenyltransferase domain-containing protein [Desulfobacterales bacterium]